MIEAEYITTTSGATHITWLHQMLFDLNHAWEVPTKIFCDDKSTITLPKNPVFHGRNKYIDIKFYYIHDLVEDINYAWVLLLW